MTKVVLVNAYETEYLGTRLLASWLRQHGFETHNIHMGHYKMQECAALSETSVGGYQIYMGGRLLWNRANSDGLGPEDWANLERVLREEKPDIIGFSARSANNYLIPTVAPLFRHAAPGALLVAGGYGPTLEPERYLDGGFDVVVRGDGEEAMLALARAVEARDAAAMKAIPGTCWGGGSNPLADQVKDLRAYPPPLTGDAFFTLIEDGRVMRHHDAVLHSNAYWTYFGKGCTGRCTYCSGGQWSGLYKAEGRKFYKRRNRDVGQVLDELAALPPGVEVVIFADEYWALPVHRTREFLQAYKERVGLPFWAYFSYEQMVNNPDLLELALDAGLNSTGIGFQTGSAEFARAYYGRNPDYDLLVEYARRLFRNFVFINPQFILGNCYETLDDFRETVRLVRRLPFSIETPFQVMLQMTRLLPHPGTPITRLAPRVVTDPMPAKEWYWRSVLLELARITDAAELDGMIADGWLRDDPAALDRFFNERLAAQRRAWYAELVEREAGKPWVFYGGGDLYARNRKFFAPLRPEAILMDRKWLPVEKRVDGIPVMTPEDFFAASPDPELRAMVFSSVYNLMQRRLLRKYGMARERIHAATACLDAPQG